MQLTISGGAISSGRDMMNAAVLQMRDNPGARRYTLMSELEIGVEKEPHCRFIVKLYNR